MGALRSEEGAALVTALMLTMLSLVMAMALLSTVMTGIRVSASQKRYRTALTAAQGGVELLTREIVPRLFQPEMSPGSASLDLNLAALKEKFVSVELKLTQYDCLHQKLNNPTGKWSACTAPQGSSDPADSPDLTFKLSSNGGNGFSVSAKIVDTVPGNSDKIDNADYLDTGGGVTGRDEVIHPRHVPTIFSLSVQGVRDGGKVQEKARLSVLYAY